MSPLLALAGAGLVHEGVTRHRPDAAIPAAAVAAVVLLRPPTVLPLAAAGGLWLALHWLREHRPVRHRSEEEAIALTELTVLGLSAGLSFAAALRQAADVVGGPRRREVEATLRRARRIGLAPALQQADGPSTRLFLLAAEAIVSGAPLAAALEAHARELEDIRRTRRLEAARKMPVKLLVPLALLILPGFVLLTLGPALTQALERLRFP